MSDSEIHEVIKELMEDHRNIMMMFLQAFALDIKTEEGKSIFKNAFLELQLHDDKEEVLLYQPIRESYLDNNASDNIQIFSDMKHFGIENTLNIINDFDDSLDGCDKSNLIHLESKYLNVIDVIKERIKFEETVLFETYSHIKP